MPPIRATVTAQLATVRGMALSFAPACPDGDSIAVGRGAVLLVRNGSDVPVTVTVRVPHSWQGLDVADNVVEVQRGETYFLALRPDVYARPRGSRADAGRVHVDYSTTEGVTRAVIGS